MVAVEDGLESLQPAAVVHIGSLTSGSEKRALQSIPRRCAYRPKTKPPVPDFRKPAAFFPATLPLGLDDPRSYEENQLLVRSSDGCVSEQVAQPWNAAQQRNLRNANRVVGLNDATDDHGTAVGDQHLRGRLLRDQSGVTVDGASEVRGRVLDVHIEEDRALRGDLRNHGEPQEGIDVGYCRGTAQLRLGHDGDAHALANQSLDVVLRHHPRTG